MGANASALASVIPSMKSNISAASAQIEGLKAISNFVVGGETAQQAQPQTVQQQQQTSNTISSRAAAAIKAGALHAISSAMNAHSTNPQVQIEGCKSISSVLSSGLVDPALTQPLSQRGNLISLITTAMKSHSTAPSVISAACTALSSFASPTDSSNIETLLKEGVPELIVNSMTIHTSESSVQDAALNALASIASSGSTGRDAANSANAISAAVCALKTHMASPDVARSACKLLASAAAGSDSASADVLNQGGVKEAVSALQRMGEGGPLLAEAACLVVGNVAARSDECASAAITIGAHIQACSVLKSHANDAKVQRSALFLLAALSSRGGSVARDALSATEAPVLIVNALKMHKTKPEVIWYAFATIADLCINETARAALCVAAAAAASAGGSISTLVLNAMKSCSNDPRVQTEGCRAISTLCGSSPTGLATDMPNSEAFIRDGALQAVISTFKSHVANNVGSSGAIEATESACMAIASLCSCSESQALGKEIVGILLKIITNDTTHPGLVGAACLALGRAISLSEGDRLHAMKEGDGPVSAVARAMVSVQPTTNAFRMRCCASISCLALAGCAQQGPGDCAISPVVSVLREHGNKSPIVAEEALHALSSLLASVVSNSANANSAKESNKSWAADAVIREGLPALAAGSIRDHYQDRPGVAEQGCKALSFALISASNELSQRILLADTGALSSACAVLRLVKDGNAVEAAAALLAAAAASGESGRSAVCSVPNIWNAVAAAINSCLSFPRALESACRCISNAAVCKDFQGISEAIVDAGAARAVIDAMKAQETDPGVQEAATLAIANIAARGGKATNDLGGLNAVSSVIKAMNLHPSSSSMQRNGCFALGALCSSQNDTIRSDVLKNGGPKCIVHAMNEFALSEVHQKFGCIALGNIARCSGAPTVIIQEGGITAMISALRAHPSSQSVQAEASRTLGKLFRNDPAATAAAGNDAIGLLVAAARGMSSYVVVQECVISAIAGMLSNGGPAICEAFIKEGTNDLLLAATKAFPSNTSIQKNVCSAISHLANPNAAVPTAPRTTSPKVPPPPGTPPPQNQGTSPPTAPGNLPFLMTTMKENQASSAAQESGIRGICALAMTSKSIAHLIVSDGGLKLVLEAMHNHQDSPIIQELGITLIGVLAQNGIEGSLPRGSGDSVGANLISAIVAAMKKHSVSTSVQMHGCSTMAAMAATGGYKAIASLLQAEAIPAIVSAMKHPSTKGEPAVQKTACHALAAIASAAQDTSAAVSITNAGGIQAVIAAMRGLPQSASTQELGCLALANVGTRGDNFVSAIAEEGGVEAVLSAFRAFGASSQGVQRSGCFAIAVLASRANEAPRSDLCRGNAVNFIINSLSSATDHHLIKYAMVALANLSLFSGNNNGNNNTNNCKYLERDDNGTSVARSVTLTMKTFISSAGIASEAARAVGKIASSSTVLLSAMTREGVVPTLLSVMRKHPDSSPILRYSITALGVLASNGDNIVDSESQFEMILKAMREHPMDPSVQESATCTISIMAGRNNDSIKTQLGSSGAPALIVSAIRTHIAYIPVLKSCCMAICSLIGAVGQQQQQQQHIGNVARIAASGGIPAIISAMKTHSDSALIQEETGKALSAMFSADSSANRPSLSALIACEGGIEVIINSMKLHPTIASHQRNCCHCIAKLAGFPGNQSEQVAAAMFKNGVLDLIINAMKYHAMDAGVQEDGCLALSNLAAANVASRAILSKREMSSVIISSLATHVTNVSIQENGCRALGNIAAHDSCATLPTETADASVLAILTAMRMHPTSSTVQECCYLAMANMAARNEHCTKFALHEGVVALIISAMRSFPMSVLVQKNASFAIAALAAKAVKPERDSLISSDSTSTVVPPTITTLVSALRVLPSEEVLHKYCAIAIANLSQDDDVLNSATLSEVIPSLFTSIRAFPKSDAVLSECCRAIAKLCTGRTEAINICLRLGGVSLMVSAIKGLPTRNVLLRAFTAISKMCINNTQSDSTSSAADSSSSNEVIENIINGLLLIPNDVALRKAGCKALECFQTASTSNNIISTIFKSAVSGTKTETVSLWIVSALSRGGSGETTRDAFLQSGMARLLVDVLATSQNKDVLEAACSAIGGLASSGGISIPSSITQLAPSIESALARCNKIANQAQEALSIIHRTVDPTSLDLLSRGFCAASSAAGTMIYTRPCNSCGLGMRCCDICASKCHGSHSISENGRRFGVFGCCGCKNTSCKSIRFVIESPNTSETKETTIKYSDSSCIILRDNIITLFNIDQNKQLSSIEVLSGDPPVYIPIVIELPLPQSIISSNSADIPIRLRVGINII